MTGRALAALVVLLLALTGCGGADASAPDRVGRAAQRPDRLPATTLRAFDGTGSLDLRTLKGPAVVNLWASWCTPCRRELPFYQSFSRAHAGKVDVIGIDFQETRVSKARELVQETGVTYPLYADPDGTLRAQGLPKVLLVAADGTVAHEEYVEIKDLGQLEKLVRTYLPGTIR